VLKKWIGNGVPIQEELSTLAEEANVLKPQAVLERRSSPKGDEVLIHWYGHSPADATWELRAELSKRFPDFNLEDKVQLKGKGVLWLHEGPTKEVAHGLDVLKEGQAKSMQGADRVPAGARKIQEVFSKASG